ncbi:hypothetical protein ASPVEDRAFT_37382 [Aspergillus versicolor CBS 583.65]|uniref:Transcription factor domain-containing protein n=1 Tax=Aspergillus versicolor CBS 583.65 TaxID=1036611 RepID=A0A1L9P8V9_ASPVE|nr:uncharacterized protein ASPVEDRAFT_37382 [Aspergillus versicolor CBS 583.65]OJI97916.1 hypothetical protein ASPVEDRAFT_37382 [Aspergillus versicolor CBS 583.65]
MPSLDLVNSLQHTERDLFYSTYWEDACLPALHPMFGSISFSAGEQSMLKDAILALSSCNISRIKPDRRGPSSLPVAAFSPNLVHQTRSQLYYSSAIRKFMSLSLSDFRSNAAIVFTVLVLFAYIESSMGNFQGFQCHVQGLTNFLLELREVMGEAMLKALLSAWMQVRFVVWWARAYFSSINVYRDLPSVRLPELLAENFNTMQERRVMVLSIMCESHRLNSREALSHWRPDISENESEIRSYQTGGSKTADTTFLQLAEQANKLDEWLACLPPSELPFPLYSKQSDCSQRVFDNTDDPIYFESHHAALSFAYYVVARIMQCTHLLRELDDPSIFHSGPRLSEEEAWIRFLLRVAKGTNIRESISKNSYTIGFSGLMLAAILRCQNRSLGIEIQNWLEALQRLQPTEEGAFPVYQTLAVVKAVNQQKMMGREIFGVTLPSDDAGGTPKFKTVS